jgi:Family of unknown function (DUF6804)
VHTQVMKWVSIAALLVAVLFWNSGANYQLELNLVVSVAAVVVLVQAFQAKKYGWAACFLVIAVLFNPALPVFRLAGGVGLALVVLSIAPFAISLIALRPHPLLSIPSITDRTPGSQSL